MPTVSCPSGDVVTDQMAAAENQMVLLCPEDQETMYEVTAANSTRDDWRILFRHVLKNK